MNKVKKLKLNDPSFPQSLINIPSPPKQIFVLGDLEPLLALPRLAVVGSRRVTPYGKHVTNQLVSDIARSGVVVVSGLALGVDAIAHQACLDVGGKTIAVLANGLDQISPRSNHHLARQILDSGGAIISEYPAGSPPQKENFVIRNRIVSGISDGVLITEAASKSGTMHTANFALEQGKVVMSVPGNIISSMSEGTNNLIKTGALAVTSYQDIQLALGLSAEQFNNEVLGVNQQETTIIMLLREGVTEASVLLQRSRLEPAVFNQTLTMMEITGKIYSLGADNWALR